MRYRLLALLFLLTITSCTSVPQPVPVPSPDTTLMALSSPDTYQSKSLIIGLPGSVKGEGQIEFQNELNESFIAPTANKGSFAILVNAKTSLRVRFIAAEGTSPFVQYTPTLSTYGDTLEPADAIGTPISSPNAQGIVTVSNANGTLIAPGNAELIIGNQNNGEIVIVETNQSGIFSATLNAKVGDTIHLTLIKDEFDTLSNHLSYGVPSS